MAYKLTPEEERWIELVINSPTLDEFGAAKEVYKDLKDITSKVKRLRSKKVVQEELQRRLEISKYRVDYTEKEILDALWAEATYKGKGSSHNARISALVWLGKHINMFKDKVVESTDSSVTYNIVNYQNAMIPKQMKGEVIEHQEEVKEKEDKVVNQLTNDLLITRYE